VAGCGEIKLDAVRFCGVMYVFNQVRCAVFRKARCGVPKRCAVRFQFGEVQLGSAICGMEGFGGAWSSSVSFQCGMPRYGDLGFCGPKWGMVMHVLNSALVAGSGIVLCVFNSASFRGPWLRDLSCAASGVFSIRLDRVRDGIPRYGWCG